MTKSNVQSTTGGRGEATRRRLVEATVVLVAEHGWQQVTTRQIAERARANQALINYHFGSKDGLLRTAADVALREGFKAPMEAMLQAPSFVEGCVALVHELAAMDEAEPIVRFSMEALANAARDEALRRTMAELLAELRALLADGIREAQRRGELAAEIDPVGTATLLGGIFDGMGLHLLIDPSLDVTPAAVAVRRLLIGTKEDQ